MKPNDSQNERINRSIPWIVCIVFFLLCGALMIFCPKYSLRITAVAIGVVLTIIGIKNIVVFFTSPAEKAMNNLSFGTGLLSVFGGILFLLNPVQFNNLLSYAWAVSILIGAFFKLQIAIVSLRIKAEKWWLSFALAGASLIMGFIAFFIFSPQVDPDLPQTMIPFGIFLWVEALMDAFCYIFLILRFKEIHKAVSAVAGTVPPKPAAPATNFTDPAPKAPNPPKMDFQADKSEKNE